MQIYIDLFINAALGKIFIPFIPSYMMPTLIAFGGYNNYVVVAISVLASMVGYCINYSIGRISTALIEKNQGLSSSYIKTERIFNVFGLLVLPFSWFLFLNIITVMAGALRTRVIYFLPLVLLGEVIHQIHIMNVWR